MPTETKPTVDLKIEVKNVKHTFTADERDQIGGDLARAFAGLRGIENEFDQVKAAYKAKTTEAEAKIDNLSTARINGFEMRNKRCVVVFRPKNRKKDYYLEEDGNRTGSPVVLTEDMTRDDFQAELIQAESKFENREEIDLFQATETDNGIMVVGRLAGKWFSALRVKIGKLTIEERLDSEQRAFKARSDAVAHAVKRASEWCKENLKDLAKGFQDQFSAVVSAHKERAE